MPDVRAAWLVAVAMFSAACGRLNFDVVDAPPPDAVPDAYVCASPYMIFSTSCYRVIATPATWLVAEQQCEADGAHLINVADIPEHFDLHMMLATAGLGASWVGYTDRRTEGSFLWVTPGGVDPMPTSSCFLGGVVNIAGADCVAQDATNACPDWHIVNCDATSPFVCEHDAFLADVATY